ncbi:MAG: class I SAM-dependent methyltransferase [Chitinophagaceae bacterium]
MFTNFILAKKYLHYYLTASNGKGHGIHSPFIFQFVQQVLNDHKKYYAYNEIEAVRKQMLKDPSLIDVEDKGAGSTATKSKTRSISQIAHTALKPKKYAQLLFRMVNYYQSNHIIELGTSLGITTAYLAAARTGARLVTIEGSPAIAEKAAKNFNALSLSNIRIVTGGFEEMLQPELSALGTIDFAFIDGNHRKAPTLQYFEQILQHTHLNSILVFDDIHWSSEMEEAWGQIKNHPSVTCTVDLFFIGLVFLKDEFKTRQHFLVRF